MAIERTVKMADAYANDDGGVTLEQEGNLLPVSIVEAATFAASVMNAAIEAAQASAEKDAAPGCGGDADADAVGCGVVARGHPVSAPEVVCLCGSTRFYDEFQEANYDLTMAGKIVLSVGFWHHTGGRAHADPVADDVVVDPFRADPGACCGAGVPEGHPRARREDRRARAKAALVRRSLWQRGACRDICPSHAQKCHVRTQRTQRTQRTHASKTRANHLLFLTARAGLWISHVTRFEVA